MKNVFRLGLAALAVALTAGVASAATGPSIVEAGDAVYPDRAYILSLPAPKSLTRSDVGVSENGGRVTDLRVAQEGAAGGTAVVLAIDASESMAGRPIADAVDAAHAFVAQMRPGQQVAIVTFDGSVNTVHGFTTDRSKLFAALESTPKIGQGTKLYDALEQSLGMVAKSGAANSSIVLLSDGADIGSKTAPATALGDLRGAHVRVFSVGLVSRHYNGPAMEKIGTASRGVYVKATGPSQLTPIFNTIGKRLASEYLLTYKSRVNPSTHVAVKVSVKGFPAPATSQYTTPALHIPVARPYHPARLDAVLQSYYTMIAVALALAALLGYAVMYATASRADPLVDRVGDFVSVQRTDHVKRDSNEKGAAGSVFLTALARRTTRPSWSMRLGETLELAGIGMGPVQFVLLTAFATIVIAVVLGVLLGIVGFLFGALTPLAVRAFVRRRLAKKRRQFAEQLPDNLDVLASALRAGHSLVGALSVVAENAPEPSRTEFRRVLAEEQFGAQLEDAFKVTVDRMGNVDLDQVALVARLQREMGSNSAEVLDRVIETVRGRMELRRLIRTLTAQGRMSRWVLTGLPIALAILLTLISPTYMHPLYHTTVGQALLLGAALMVALGSWVIGKIVDIEV